MKLRIKSDGTSAGTEVINEETGEPLKRVKSVSWSIKAEAGRLTRSTARIVTVDVIRVDGVALDVEGVSLDAVGETS